MTPCVRESGLGNCQTRRPDAPGNGSRVGMKSVAGSRRSRAWRLAAMHGGRQIEAKKVRLGLREEITDVVVFLFGTESIP